MTTEELRPTGSSIALNARLSVREARASMKPLMISGGLMIALIGLLVFSVRFFVLGEGVGLHKAGDPIFTVNAAALNFLAAIFQSAVQASLAVATHRLILKKEITPGIIALNRPYHWAFFAWLLAFNFFGFALNGLALLAGVAVAFIAALIGLFVFINSILIFPAVAIEAQTGDWMAQLRSSWRQMNGHFWLAFRAAILAVWRIIILGVVIIMVVAMIATVATYSYHLDKAAMPLVLGISTAVVAAFVQPFTVMLGAAVASYLYLWIQSHPVDQTQSAQIATSTVT